MIEYVDWPGALATSLSFSGTKFLKNTWDMGIVAIREDIDIAMNKT